MKHLWSALLPNWKYDSRPLRALIDFIDEITAHNTAHHSNACTLSQIGSKKGVSK